MIKSILYLSLCIAVPAVARETTTPVATPNSPAARTAAPTTGSAELKNTPKQAKTSDLDIPAGLAMWAGLYMSRITSVADLRAVLTDDKTILSAFDRDFQNQKDIKIPEITMPKTDQVQIGSGTNSTLLSFHRITEGILLIDTKPLRLSKERTLNEYLNELKLIKKTKSAALMSLFVEPVYAADLALGWNLNRFLILGFIGTLTGENSRSTEDRMNGSTGPGFMGWLLWENLAQQINRLQENDFDIWMKRKAAGINLPLQITQFTCRMHDGANQVDTLLHGRPFNENGEMLSDTQTMQCPKRKSGAGTMAIIVSEPCFSRVTRVNGSSDRFQFIDSIEGNCRYEFDMSGKIYSSNARPRLVQRPSDNFIIGCPTTTQNALQHAPFKGFLTTADACCKKKGCPEQVRKGLETLAQKYQEANRTEQATNPPPATN